MMSDAMLTVQVELPDWAIEALKEDCVPEHVQAYVWSAVAMQVRKDNA